MIDRSSLTIEQMNAALSGRYQLERELGSGGMATVFLARDLKHDREVAIKVLRADLSAVLGAERFLAEVRITARLDHPHILTLIDSGEADGILYYVLPVVRGESLRAKLQREKQLGIDEAIALTKQVASALDYAHAQGVVHRDIKPENILIHQGEAVLTDFGIALAVREAGGNRLTETGLSLGTPQYMSPEQATGDRTLDARSDVYSLAAVLYEMLGGEPPVTGATAQAMIAKLLMEKPTSLRVVRDTVPEAMDRAIARGLSKVPADRFASAGEFARALDAGMGAPTAANPRASRRPAMITASALVVVVILAVIGWRAFAARTSSRAVISLGDRKQVTFNGRALRAAISDDAKSVAYTFEECAAAGCTYAIEVQDVGSQVTRRLLSGAVQPIRSMKWSPDRRSILYWGETAMGLLSAMGGPPIRLGSLNVAAVDFFGSDSLVMVDAQSRYVKFTGIDGISRARLGVVDSAEKLTVDDMFAVPESRWFLLLLEDSTGAGRFRVIDRSGRRASETAFDKLYAHEWASADALWRLMPVANFAGDRFVLLRYPFDGRNGKLSAMADTIYTGNASYFDVARDGKNVVLNEGSTSYETRAVELRDLFRRQVAADRLLESSTKSTTSIVSPDGQRVFVAHALTSGYEVSVRPFSGGPAISLSLPEAWGLGVSDSVDLAFFNARGRRLQFGIVDVRTGATRDTLLLPADATLDATTAVGGVPPNGWMWNTRAGGLMLQQRVDQSPHVVPLPAYLGLVTALHASRDGRRLAVAGRAKSAPDSTTIVVMNVDGSSPVIWATVLGPVFTLVMDEQLAGFIQSQSVVALDGPGHVRLLGRVPMSGTFSVSADLKRAVITASEYHGDAWLTKVIRR